VDAAELFGMRREKAGNTALPAPQHEMAAALGGCSTQGCCGETDFPFSDNFCRTGG